MELWVAFGFGAAVGALIGYLLGRQKPVPAPSRARPAPPSKPPSASPDVKHVVLDEGSANADVEKGRPSRSRFQDCPLASMPLRTRRVPSAGINTVHTP